MRESEVLNKAYQNYQMTTKGVPAYACDKAVLTGSKNPERVIKDKIEKYLKWIGHYCVIVDSSAHYNKDVGRYIKSETSLGCPDLIASINGKFVGIEVKRIYENSRDRQSEVQKKVENRIISDKGQYWIVNDFMSFYEMLTKFK